ncbi:MAG: TIGR03118 family protein [Bryobacteraceae bacterium]
MNKRFYRPSVLTTLIGSLLTFAGHAQTRGYVETDLVVNRQAGGVPTLVDSNGITHIASFFDPNLVNPWGLTSSATGVFWVADAGAGVATLYNTAGTPQPLIVSIPSAANPLGNDGIPTGAVFNSVAAQGAFKLSGVNSAGNPVTAPASFLFATKDGNILGWNPGVNPPGFDPAKAGKYAVIAVPNSATAAYTGLALATDAQGATRLYAANFRAGTVDVFDTAFTKVSSNNAFFDPSLPRGYAPFNIAPITIDGATWMFVTYAIPDPRATFGQGHGIVNAFLLDGSQPRRFAQHGQLNAPWGIVLTPAGFGELGGTLWIGNFGDGRINAYDPRTGEFVNKVRTPEGKAIVLDRLWSLKVGNGGTGGNLNTLYFTAGPNDERDGLFGSLDPQ